MKMTGATGVGAVTNMNFNVVPDSETWTLVVIPDTQRLAAYNATAYNTLIQWVVDNKVTEDIRMVMHVGDYVDDGTSSAQWSATDTAMNRLHTNSIPFIHCAGNHDYDDDGAGGVYTRDTNTYWETVFPASDWSGYSWYIDEYDGITTNQAATLTIGTKKYLFLTLEVFPRAAAISWADSVISAQNPDRIILITHMNVTPDGSHSNETDLLGGHGDTPDAYSFCNYSQVADCDTGEELYTSFISQHSELILVVNGHDIASSTGANGTIGKTAYARRTDTVGGNTVNQHLINYQNNSGNGYNDAAVLRMYKFDHSDNSCDVTTYNAVHDSFYTDSENQFSFNYT